jgi:D-beta-D-heptose 7-phosphate kinase/D-beta-D-heptose 1-phosphate adenosyltransferase
VEYLQQARALGDLLVVGLNEDSAVRQLKGPGRPWVPQEDRAALLCALQDVDVVTLFPETSVELLVAELLPDVLVKGGDYALEEVVGRQVVENAGGQVCVLCHVADRSTRDLLPTVEAAGRSGSGTLAS